MHIVYPAVVSALLFSIGVYGVLVRRNTILVLMSVELMLNAVNLNLVAFDVWLADRLHSGQVLTLFVIVIAAAEVGLGLAIVLALYRNRRTVDIDHLRDLAEPTDEPTETPAIAGTPADAARSATTPVRGHAIASEHTPDPAASDPATPANTVEPTEGRPRATAEPNEHHHTQPAQAPQAASDGTGEADRTGQAETEGGRGDEQPAKRGGTL